MVEGNETLQLTPSILMNMLQYDTDSAYKHELESKYDNEELRQKIGQQVMKADYKTTGDAMIQNQYNNKHSG